ncbi:MAG: hypothetical protein M5T61_07375 [Acidimicrobiia bacterium]|nr:hypothetical protein [Acidimicrobiia bacterium]
MEPIDDHSPFANENGGLDSDGDDAACPADAADAIVRELRRELLKPPLPAVVEQHLAAMATAHAGAQEPPGAPSRGTSARRVRSAMPWAASILALASFGGAAAAGALPRAAQRVAAELASVIGVQIPDGRVGPAPADHGRPGSDAPGRSGTAPGQTGNTPGQSGNTPGQSGDDPGNSGNAPGHTGENPGNSGNAPGHTGNTPGQSGDDSGNSGNAPGQTGDDPGNSGNAPGHTGNTPGQSGNAPGHTGDTPGQSGDTPGQSGDDPGNSGNAPGHTGENPGNSGNAPGHTGERGGSSDG